MLMELHHGNDGFRVRVPVVPPKQMGTIAQWAEHGFIDLVVTTKKL